MIETAFGPYRPSPRSPWRAWSRRPRGAEEVGLALRRQDARAAGPMGRATRTSNWEVKDGVDRRHRPGLDALQPEGRLQELPVPGRDQDQRPRQLGDVLPLPKAQRQLLRGLRGPGQQHPRRPDPHRLALHLRPHLRQLVPPDTWFTQEIEAVDKDFRGTVIPHIKVMVNGKMLYDVPRPRQRLEGGPLRLPAARPGQPGRDPQGRGHGTAVRRRR